LEYAKHLRKAGVEAERWEIEYIDDGTRDRWLLDYPESEQHGGGNPRLRKLSAQVGMNGVNPSISTPNVGFHLSEPNLWRATSM
jgi:hypothetical protein